MRGTRAEARNSRATAGTKAKSEEHSPGPRRSGTPHSPPRGLRAKDCTSRHYKISKGSTQGPWAHSGHLCFQTPRPSQPLLKRKDQGPQLPGQVPKNNDPPGCVFRTHEFVSLCDLRITPTPALGAPAVLHRHAQSGEQPESSEAQTPREGTRQRPPRFRPYDNQVSLRGLFSDMFPHFCAFCW